MEPLLVAPLLAKVEAKLLELLAGISTEEWNRPTMVAGWKVRHVAGHLLDTSLRKLSVVRDGVGFDGPASGAPEDVRRFVDRVNAEGVAAYGRLSPQVLGMLQAKASAEFCAFHEGLDPFAEASFAVSWAGESQSPNWFDTARELTERWHHQQQIRMAVERPGIMSRELYHPVLDCFMRALPHTFRDVPVESECHLQVTIQGDCGGDWYLCGTAVGYRPVGWRLAKQPMGECVARIAIPQEIAWRVFTKGIGRTEAEAQSTIEGDAKLASELWKTIAIVG